MNVQPDLDFIRHLKQAGGDTLKKCYQCSTCSVMCPLSKDGKPFPRKEMIWAQWGLKEKLIADPDVFLCHQCGDCTAGCPRGAKPGDVLSAIRSWAYTEYGWPGPLAKLASTAKGLPVLVALPVVVILLMWLASSLIGVSGVHLPSKEEFALHGYQQFFGTWNFHWYAKNIAFIVAIMVPALGIGLFSAGMGVYRFWKKMSINAGINGAFKPSIYQFVTQLWWPAAKEIVTHKRFKECNINETRTRGHLPLMYAFAGLFIVTCWSLLKNDVLGLFWPALHGPLPLTDPFKLLANVSAIAMIFGLAVLWANRKRSEREDKTMPTFYDWFLLWEIAAVGVTGIGAEVLRWMGIPIAGYIVYFLHLVSIFMLFLYLPYTKFAHIVFRTAAMTFDNYRESVFAKNPLDQ
ncbi:quinone-interacting membrane-bound oxidoreductase complex subunit QmoC [Desulfotalea psychrophila]|uniref:Probable heterodisulfide reductase, subunit E (HdrE) n=1 Tax=Desulfotalea psychrophila (strain LSv54 / DSM 12343) TaxID=177439 RepID=Q6AP87_DESPS|nr:quinone-interacting membrane-bound oxidoreductase complex subunit QmoC [Desulfotalea psychrophila]CAG35837.1 probable heterodisulfide reductase, subunit E (HdrE) [Desulfotalea psychrophila LSv54]